MGAGDVDVVGVVEALPQRDATGEVLEVKGSAL